MKAMQGRKWMQILCSRFFYTDSYSYYGANVEKYPVSAANLSQDVEIISTLLNFFFAYLAWVSANCKAFYRVIVTYL